MRLIAILLIWLLCSAFGPGWQKPPLGARLNQSLAQGLNVCLLLNEGSGNAINDLGGNSSPRLIAGGWSSTSSGEAMRFRQAGNEYIDLMDSTAVTKLPLAVSFELLTYITDDQVASRCLFSWDKASSYRSTLYATIWRTRTFNGVVTDNLVYNGAINAGLHHIVCVYDGQSKLFYLDGILNKSQVSAHAGAPIGNDSNNVWLGRAGDIVSWGQKVVLFRLWNRALNLNEIQSLCSQPYAMFQRPALARTYLNFGTGVPPVTTPERRLMGQEIILGKAGREDIIAWR